ncbi:MAG: Uma2 family endonuclease [Cyanobacteriota bacterium]|nr:Uma2 family endonuclease [Cyanobacteriota bacterium]
MFQIQTRPFTVDEYHKMIQAEILTEDDRVELLAGEIVQMSPIGTRHAACVNRLTHMFTLALGRRAIISVQNPIQLSSLSEPEPDVAIVKARPDFYANAHPKPEDVLLLIEVADTSVGIDRTVKLPLYAEAGIVEVWLIDLVAEQVGVYRQPTPQGYEAVEQVGAGHTVSPSTLPDFEVEVDEVLGLS